jgi:hypothetical protein
MFDAEGYEGIGVAAESGYGKPEGVRLIHAHLRKEDELIGQS